MTMPAEGKHCRPSQKHSAQKCGNWITVVCVLLFASLTAVADVGVSAFAPRGSTSIAVGASALHGTSGNGLRYSCIPGGNPLHAPRVLWPNAEYTETHVDLKVKALGGYVEIPRTWTQGRWTVNPVWEPLDFQLDPLNAEVQVVGRSGTLYQRSGNAELYTAQYQGVAPTFVRKLKDGWQWFDRLGNTIDYDLKGRPRSYTKPTAVTVRFVHDSETQTRILDHHGNTLLIATMAEGVITQIASRAGHVVHYQWSGSGEARRLDKVIDAAGQEWSYQYDGNGQITQRTDPAGQKTRIQYASSVTAPPTQLSFTRLGRIYDPSTGSQQKIKNTWGAARVGSFTDCLGTVSGSTQFLSSSRQFKVDITSSRGQSKTFYYPAVYGSTLVSAGVSGQSSVRDHLGRLLAQAVWDGRHVEKFRDPRGTLTTTEYTYDYQPSLIVHADGAREAFAYEAERGLIQQYTDPLGIKTQWKYAKHGLPVEQIEAVGTSVERKTTWQYDQWGQVIAESLGEGADAIVWQYAYDENGNATQITDPAGKVWKLGYDLSGQVTSVTNPLGHTTGYAYDSRGNLTRRTSPSGKVETTKYNSIGLATEMVDAMGRVSALAYNGQGQIATVTNALSHVATYTYNEHGNPVSETTPAGKQSRFEHDEEGRVVAYTDPAGNRIAFEHGDYGSSQAELLTTIQYPGGLRQEFKYDQRGRQTLAITRAQDGSTLAESTTYDAGGNAVAITSAGGQTVTGRYDPLARLVTVTNVLGGSSTTTYNLLDQPTSITDAKGNTTRYRYDKTGRLIEAIHPEGGITGYTYDGAGQFTHIAYPDGARIQYDYDVDGNLIKETHTGTSGALEQSTTYQVNAAGERTGYHQKGADGKTISAATYLLDALGRAAQERITYGEGANAITRTLIRTWDADFNTTSVDYAGQKTTIAYDKGKPASIRTPAGQTIRITQYEWDYPKTIEYPGATRTQRYDGFYRPSAISVKNEARQTLLNLENQFNKESSIIRQGIEQAGGISGNIDYEYDPLDRLTSASPSQSLLDFGLNREQYEYDATHNRTSSAHQPGYWQYDSGNRLTRKGYEQTQVSYTYTASGHVSTSTQNGSTRQYHYDAGQRLIAITEGGQTIASYQYDPAGRRIRKTTGQGASAVTTWYLYSDEGLLAEINAAGEEVRSYGWQPDTGWGSAPLWQINHGAAPADAQYHFLHTDHLERPLLASDASGAVTWQALAESFGQSRIGSASSAQINLRLPGQYWDEETGTHYNQQRDYDPQTGRYIQSDPLGLYDGVNTYSYAHQNPLSYTDPTGEAVPAAPFVYVRCIAQCKATDALLAAIKSECDPRTLGDCAKECLNPLAWIGGSKAKHAKNNSSPPNVPRINGENYFRPGPYAGPGVLASKGPSRKIPPNERAEVNRQGDQYGCHTCGAKDSGRPDGKWIPDHQPPNSMNPDGGAQKLYPHCKKCSSTQGGLARWHKK